MKRFNIGVIGLGMISEGHLPGYTTVEEAELIAVSTRRDERLEWAKKNFNVPKTYTDWKKMLDNEPLDIVSILAPEQVHKEMCCYAAEKGMHILVEKPLAMNMREIEEIKTTIEKNNVKLIVSQNYRWFPETIQAKKDIEEGIIGEIYYLEFRELAYFHQIYRSLWNEITPVERPFFGYPPNNFEYQWIDKGAHSVDLLRYLTGMNISKIYLLIGGHGWLPTPGENTSFASVVLGNDKVIGQMLHLWGTHTWGPRAFNFSMGFRIEGEDGTIIVARGHERDPYNTKTQYSIYKKEKLVYSTSFPIIPSSAENVYAREDPHARSDSVVKPGAWHSSFAGVLKELIGAIKNNREPMCNIDDNLHTIKAIVAGYESVRTKKAIEVEK